jgi:hypothetical protein
MERKYLTEWKQFLTESDTVDPQKFYDIILNEVNQIKKTIQDMNPTTGGKPSEVQVTTDGKTDYQRYNLQIKTPGVSQTNSWTNLATINATMTMDNSWQNLKNFWIGWRRQFDTMTFAKKLRNDAGFEFADKSHLMSIARAVNEKAMASKQVFDQQIDRFDAATKTIAQ